MIINISKGIATIRINTDGGYIDSYEINGRDIFYPKTMIKIDGKETLRGGMHICAPNFSKDNIYKNLPMHGFARDMNWNVTKKEDNNITLTLDGCGIYEDVNFKIEYILNEKSLKTKLLIKNNSQKEVLIAPAFHPYFACDENLAQIPGLNLENDELYQSIFYKENGLKFDIRDYEINISGNANVNEFVLWTDFRGDYICIEPTYNSIAFNDKDRKPYTLLCDESFLMDFDIEIKI